MSLLLLVALLLFLESGRMPDIKYARIVVWAVLCRPRASLADSSLREESLLRVVILIARGIERALQHIVGVILLPIFRKPLLLQIKLVVEVSHKESLVEPELLQFLRTCHVLDPWIAKTAFDIGDMLAIVGFRAKHHLLHVSLLGSAYLSIYFLDLPDVRVPLFRCIELLINLASLRRSLLVRVFLFQHLAYEPPQGLFLCMLDLLRQERVLHLVLLRNAISC